MEPWTPREDRDLHAPPCLPPQSRTSGDGAPALVLPYWEGTRVPTPPVERFLPALGRVGARFMTADLARRVDGEWLLLEVGDGQVSGLPEDASATDLYRALAATLR